MGCHSYAHCGKDLKIPPDRVVFELILNWTAHWKDFYNPLLLMGDEIIRVVNKNGRWNPAFQIGFDVELLMYSPAPTNGGDHVKE